MKLTNNQHQQLKENGISEAKITAQIASFTKGIPFVNLVKAATVNEGIIRFSKEETQTLVNAFDTKKEQLSILKFVPASGAATRMFKGCYNFINAFNPNKESLASYLEKDSAMHTFFKDIENFPFYQFIKNKIGNLSKDAFALAFVKEMLLEEGLNFGFFPKGLLPFHAYKDKTLTPFEEHLKEAVLYGKGKGEGNIHFTISTQHTAMFQEKEAAVKELISKELNTPFSVSYSYQKTKTGTIAVTMDNKPFINTDGSLLLRPSGHGALIENLNEQEADIVFVKNIDNVMVAKVEEMAYYKKVLAGQLLKLRDTSFKYAAVLDSGAVSDLQLQEIKTFLETGLNVRFSTSFKEENKETKIKILKQKINRPIRACGMVKNEGEPGGGPFWIQDQDGAVSLQIVESAQINKNISSQAAIVKAATHFNPVDLVCSIKNYKGEKYNLLDFVDPSQGFITEKTKDGKAIKALELPGLWNGAMAFWNTIFVEVPLATFNPVKTVTDLLKPAHQVN